MKKRVVVLCAVFVIMFSLMTSFSFASTSTSSTINSNQEADTSIVQDGTPFGLSDLTRNQTGLNKTYEGTYYGYCFPLGKALSSHFCAVVTSENIIVYVPQDMAQAAGFDITNDEHQAAFMSMLGELDEDLSNGGVVITSLDLPIIYTSESTYTQGETTYTFDAEIESSYYYVTCLIPGQSDCSDAASFCLSGQVLPSGDVVVSDELTWWESLKEFLDPANLDYRPLWVSLRTAGVAMVFIFILGILAAHKSMGVKSRWKSLLDSIFTIPMVLPPTVVGFILLIIFGNSTSFGRFLLNHGIELVFSWPATVIAATIVGFPLMYRTVLGAFESLDTDMLDAARTLGWSEWRVFTKLMLPLAWPSIAAGTVLAFARAMGEFGATLFVAGNYAGITQTMPIAIYFSWMGGKTDVAIFWVIVVILISFVIILIINIYTAHVQRYRKIGGKASKDDIVTEEGEVSFAIDEEAAAMLGFSSSARNEKEADR